MAHRTQRPADSHYPFDLLGRMNTSSKSTPAHTTRPGVALSSSHKSSLHSNARDDSTSPVTDPSYADSVGKREIDEFSQKHLGDRNSMIANYNNSSRQRTHYYEQQFQYKDNVKSSIRDRVQQESPVIAELRTNVIIKDEFTLVTDLSYYLAARYTRPDSAVMIKVDHSACLALGGTFDPCYILTITAVPSQMGPAMNRRNADVIQSFMADILSVPPQRGVVKFSPVAEENFAINGTTMLGEIERQEKQQSSDGGNAVRRAISNGRKSIPSFKKSSAKLDTEFARKGAKTEQKSDAKTTEMRIKAVDDYEEGGKSLPPQMPMLPTIDIFELPTVEMDKRPSTSHSHSTSTGSNGLRMNGISDVELSLQNSKALNGRPRTFSGGVMSIQDQIMAQAPFASAPAPPPIRQSSVPLSKRERPPSFLKTDPSSIAILPPRLTIPNTGASPSRPGENKSRLRNSYSDGLAGAPTFPNQAAKGHTISERSSRETAMGKDEPTANTAKRRSTIAASNSRVLDEPLPIPEFNNDTKSTKSLKVGKRKSFLSAFRRSAAAA